MSKSEALIAEAAIVKDILIAHGKNLFQRKKRPLWDISRQTVMLLHGYIISAPSLRGLTDYLAGNGFNTSCENYRFWADPYYTELKIWENLDRICQRVGSRIGIVGHSQGGLYSCALGKKFPNLVDKAVSLGTPFKGTYVALLNCLIPGARGMLPGSAYLRDLEERDFPEEVQFYSVYSPYDEAVIPSSSSILPVRRNVTNKRVDHVAHGGLIGKSCYSLIEKLLKIHP